MFSHESRFYLQYHDGYICISRLVENTHCQCTIDVVILAHHLKWSFGEPFNTRLGHPLFVLTLNRDLYISVALKPGDLLFIRALQNALFQKTTYDRMFQVFFGSTLLQKMFACCPGRKFSSSLINRKRLIYSCQAAGLSAYVSHYCRWNVAFCWSYVVNCICIYHPISVRLNA